ncbi:C4-dicarboxylate TRAP transporter substrate-binding protein [Pseudothermotoga sp.]|uniref:C4-dicarboxylate TRAP transporter substrate-binding protein n=1 Tax=Pseudothermotoga sp. TaxID=2033661 RepID=UPI0031F60E3B
MKRLLVAVVLVLTFATLIAAPKYVLKFNHVLAAGEPYHAAFLKWAKAVEERTNGDVKIEVYHSAQLGVEEDILEQIRRGAPVGQNTDSARMGMYVPPIGVMNIAYFIDFMGAKTPEEVIQVLQKVKESPSMKKWLDELENKFGFKVLSFYWVQGYRHFFTNKPIRSPADLSGLRIRTPPSPAWQESIRALGAQPVAIAFGEIYQAIQTKACDGAELTYANIYNGSLYEVVKFASETGHILLINFEVISSKWFRSLPPEYQKIVEEECDKAGIEVSLKIMKELSEDFKKKCIEKGITVITDVNKAAFMEAAKQAYIKLGIMDALEQLMKEVKGM